jgi:hypothetical protein
VGRGEDAADLLVAAVIQPVGPEVQGLYDSAAFRGFVNIDLGPTHTTFVFDSGISRTRFPVAA